ncbi:MAG: metallophosphoesterase [Oscillospiraceae bacterium]|nr:metallophosphoesterase [Oscillospiraceae bacterium]
MKILHTADWHLDAPLLGHGPALRRALEAVPGQIFEICRKEQCDLVLLSGDLFDGTYTPHSYQIIYDVLKAMSVPVFIAPGNHDYCDSASAWVKEMWPENVHIFKSPRIESVAVPQLNLRVYGAGFASMDCPALLQDFRAQCQEEYAVGVFHGDPTQINSPYNPITKAQVQASGLDYLALGHIHKADHFRTGKTLCAWPGCPMGKGYDEPGEKGVYVVTLEDTASVKFVPLDTPRFYDLQATVDTLESVLPPVVSEDYYRVTLTGTCDTPNLTALQVEYANLPNLSFRDKTTRPADVWGSLGEDSFEGVYFGLLKQMLDVASEEEKQEILLAAQLSRALLDGQEVVLP